MLIYNYWVCTRCTNVKSPLGMETNKNLNIPIPLSSLPIDLILNGNKTVQIGLFALAVFYISISAQKIQSKQYAQRIKCDAWPNLTPI